VASARSCRLRGLPPVMQLEGHRRACFLFITSSARHSLHRIAKKRQKKGASAQVHSCKVQCPRGCFQWVNHKAACWHPPDEGVPSAAPRGRRSTSSTAADIEHLLALQSRRNRQAC
jgi:hypothetical protein